MKHWLRLITLFHRYCYRVKSAVVIIRTHAMRPSNGQHADERDGQCFEVLSTGLTRSLLIWVNRARAGGAKVKVRQLAEHSDDDRDRDGLR